MTDHDNILEVRPITPTDWPLMLAVNMSTPIVNPGSHPRDPSVIWCPGLNTVGLSGLGKSYRIKAIARAAGVKNVHTVFVSTKSPASFEGAAVPTSNGIIIECILPAARKCIDAGGGLIFFDEINGATPRTQGACMSSLNDRQFGDHVVPPKTRMLTAMNPAEYSAGGFTFSAPMANRMGHVWYPTPTKDSWGSWLNGLTENVLNLGDAEKRVIDGWADNWRVINALVQGFIKRIGQDVLVDQPEPDDPRSGMAWPSYRTWHWALCALTACRCLGVGEDTQLDFIGAYCGIAPQTQWAKWIADAGLPDPEDMVRNGWTPDDVRIDRTYAALNNVTDWVVQMSKNGHRPQAAQIAEKVWGFLEATMNVQLGDLTANCAAKLHNNELGRHNTPADTAKKAQDVIFRLTKGGFTLLASS